MAQRTDAPTSQPSRQLASRIIFFHGLSSFCWGLVYPYTAVHIADMPSIGPSGVAFYFALAGGANIALAVVLAVGLARPPLVALGVAGNLASFVGYLALFNAGSLPVLGFAAVANGAGQGAFMAAVIPILNSLVDSSERRHVFARRYQVLNATLAGGAMVSGVLVATYSRNVIAYLFVVNALGYLPIAAVIGRANRHARDAAQDEQGDAAQDEQGDAARDEQGDGPEDAAAPALPLGVLLKTACAVTLFQLGAYLFGFSQFEATVPLVVDRLMDTALSWVSVLLAINVAVIVVAQDFVTKLLKPKSEIFGLRVAVALWVSSYVVAGAFAALPTAWAVAGLVAFAMLFALGECAYSCSFHPWLISKVPESELPRATALSNSTMGIGLLSGPSIGVALLMFGSATFVWLGLAALCSLVALTTMAKRRTAALVGARAR